MTGVMQPDDRKAARFNVPVKCLRHQARPQRIPFVVAVDQAMISVIGEFPPGVHTRRNTAGGVTA